MEKQIFVLALLAVVLAGCSPILKIMYPLEGTWQRSYDDGFTYEQWEVKSQNLMLGKGYAEIGEFQKELENLRLFVEDGKIIYEATVPDQNEGKPVRFPMVKHDAGKQEFVFENLAHDFPQRIIYWLVTSDSLYVVAEATTNGKTRALDFGFKKIKP